ncbi:MAG: SHOCT domain-containing protein [Candidatus Thiodiazotropha sp. (ex. Lucinoma kazani)]
MMGSGFSFGIPGFGMVVFWGIIVLLVIWLVRGITGENRSHDDKHALETLDERFARGEIDRKEYEEKKKVLG